MRQREQRYGASSDCSTMAALPEVDDMDDVEHEFCSGSGVQQSSERGSAAQRIGRTTRRGVTRRRARDEMTDRRCNDTIDAVA